MKYYLGWTVIALLALTFLGGVSYAGYTGTGYTGSGWVGVGAAWGTVVGALIFVLGILWSITQVVEGKPKR
jgi:hypothetical protein